MSYNYTTDDSHTLSYEDFIFNVKWKVADLKQEGKSDDYILYFDDCYGWHEFAKIFLEEMNHNLFRNP